MFPLQSLSPLENVEKQGDSDNKVTVSTNEGLSVKWNLERDLHKVPQD